LLHLDPREPIAYWVDELPAVGRDAFAMRGGAVFERPSGPFASAGALGETPVQPCAVPLRYDPAGPNATASKVGFDAGELIAELAMPRFGDPEPGDGTALVVRMKTPANVPASDHSAPFGDLTETTRRVPAEFVASQAKLVLDAIDAQPDVSRLNATMGARIEQRSVVYRFYNVPVGYLPDVSQGPGIIGKASAGGHTHALIAHTAARELWIDAGPNPVTLEARVTWTADELARLRGGYNGSLHPSVEISLSWCGFSEDSSSCPSPFAGHLPCIGLHRLLHTAARAAIAAREALVDVSGGQPETFLPDLCLPGTAAHVNVDASPAAPADASACQPEKCEWKATDHPHFVARLSRPCSGKQEPGRGITVSKAIDPAMRFSIAGAAGLEWRVNGRLSWRGFGESAAAQPLEVCLKHLPPSDSGEDPSSEANRWVAGFKLEASQSPTLGPAGCVGGLKLAGGAIRVGRLGSIVIRTPRTRPLAEREAGRPFEFRPHTTFSFGLPLAAVEPVRPDVPWGDRELDSPPLLVPLDRDARTAGQSPFQLDVTEAIGPDTDRHLVAKITETSTSTRGTDQDTGDGGSGATGPAAVAAGIAKGSERAASDAFVLLSTEPFGIARFSRLPLRESGDAENAIVAAFDSDTRTWLFKKVSDEYRYDFPPQGIGEAADKPGRWEVYDLNRMDGEKDIVSDSNGKVAFVRPRPTGKANASYVIDCRFSPSTSLWIRPSDVERNYFLPEWAAHEIFRQRNDLGIGAALSTLRGEFLYGLAFGLATKQETGAARSARVAEIEALMGRLPRERYSELPSVQELRERWATLRRVLKTRHERLELWTPAPADPRPFAPARFKESVRYALRFDTAAMRPPVAETSEDNGMDADGLPGGALWPIESKLFYDAIKNSPASNGGTIERIALGPTGGDADLRAEFLGGTLAIVAEVRNGFVQRQRVEIIGRIGVLWHRAKHVIMYERTVNPSAQFAPEWDSPAAPGWSRHRSRRAIVRKVSEFIELIEPVRKYPDLGSTDLRSCGFLDSVRFNSKTINVDSAWAADVEGENGRPRGYAIPLWNRGAARRRPQVYPEPDVAFVTIGEGKEERPLVAQQCLDADNLWFYSEPAAGGNPDVWPDVFGVDWGNVLPPSVIDETMTPGGGRHDAAEGGRKAPVPRVMPGYRRFTWRLARADSKTAVNAGFGDKPVFVGLDSVTFSRRVPAAASEELRKFAKRSEEMVNAQSFLTNLQEAVNGNDRGRVKSLVDEFPAGDWWEKPVEDALSITAAGPFGCADCTQGCTRIADRLTTLIDAKGRLMAQSARAWVADQCDALTDPTAQFVQMLQNSWRPEEQDIQQRLIKALLAGLPLRQFVEEVVGQATAADDVLGNEVERATAIFHAAAGACRLALTELRGRLDAVLSSFHSADVWSEQRSSAFTQQVNDLLVAVPSRLQAEIDEARRRLAAEVGPLALPAIKISGELFGPLATWVASVRISVDSQKLESWGQCKTAVDQAFVSIDGALEELASTATGLEKKIELGIQGALGDLPRLGDGTLREHAATTLAECFVRLLVEQVPQAAAEIEAVIGDANKLSKELTDVGTQLESKADEVVSRFAALAAEGAAKGVRDVALTAGEVCKTLHEKWSEGVKDLFGVTDEEWGKVAALIVAIQSLNDDIPAVKAWLASNGDTLGKAVAESTAAWHTYSGAVSEKLATLRHGGIAAAPGNALRLISAATTAPEIGVLQANVDRVRCSYEDARVKVTKARVTLNRLGDALKAMGIDVPFDGISDTLTLPETEIEKLDLTKLFPSFGGLDLRRLLPDVKVPPGVKDAVRITHDFDRKQLRAWVQVDVDVPAPGRSELYAIGPFALYLRDSKLSGRMRAEASQDEDAVRDTGSGEIATNIDVVVNGEQLLSLEQVRISYSGAAGLEFAFDPRRIRLHAAMQFVQDTFGSLFADEVGGLTVLMERGIPVGVEHLFSLPTFDLMSGTTGVANIQIGNAFRLRAYPEFVIANRFNLSRLEAPFLFTFFLLGGTGYVFVDTSYSPLSNTLVVAVEAAAGGAAAFGLSLGPVKGSAFIALSLGITYRKVIKGGSQEGDGLAVRVILVIIGNVSLKGIVTVCLELHLTITYQEGGRIDGLGVLSLKVKVAKFITLKYSTRVTYMLRNGRATTTVTSRTGVELDKEQRKKPDRIKGYAKNLEGARA